MRSAKRVSDDDCYVPREIGIASNAMGRTTHVHRGPSGYSAFPERFGATKIVPKETPLILFC